MRILIDADGSPVAKAATAMARKFSLPCLIFHDTAHEIYEPYADIFVHEVGKDSVDFALVNKVTPRDIVITQDYGLAAMVLARGGYPMDQNGREFTDRNIDELLFTRNLSRQIRTEKKRTKQKRIKGPKKRTLADDQNFQENLKRLILRLQHNP